MKAQIQEVYTSHPKPKILVIEDDRQLRDLLLTILRRSGFEAEARETGQDGFRAVQEKQFNLVISDIELPDGMNGLEICRQLKTDPKTSTVPVIIMSGRVAENNFVEAFKHGAADFISKPFSQDAIMKIVHHHIKPQEGGSL